MVAWGECFLFAYCEHGVVDDEFFIVVFFGFLLLGWCWWFLWCGRFWLRGGFCGIVSDRGFHVVRGLWAAGHVRKVTIVRLCGIKKFGCNTTQGCNNEKHKGAQYYLWGGIRCACNGCGDSVEGIGGPADGGSEGYPEKGDAKEFQVAG